jgi:precorrin-2/cobalt-factor-2 C20-methyltransferase
LPEAELRLRLGRSEAAAIIKVGRHLAKIRAVLEELGLTDRARYVERASLGTQRVLPLREAAAGDAPYFSMILVQGKS